MGVFIKNDAKRPVVQTSVKTNRIHEKQVYDAQYVYEDVVNNGIVYMSIRCPNTADAHLVVIANVEGKARFKSYKNTTWADDGTEVESFNRYIDGAKPSIVEVYQGGTVDTLGEARFDILIPAGSGPLSSGSSFGGDSESVLSHDNELTIEITNQSGNTKDIGISIEWYEERL